MIDTIHLHVPDRENDVLFDSLILIKIFPCDEILVMIYYIQQVK